MENTRKVSNTNIYIEHDMTNEDGRRKQIIRIGTWNVRIMLVPGEVEESLSQLQQYRIRITQIQ